MPRGFILLCLCLMMLFSSCKEKSQQVPNNANNLEDSKSVLTSDNLKNTITTPTVKSQNNKSNEQLLLVAKTEEFIILDGKSITEGKEKAMDVDLNGDGKAEKFLIKRDTPNGVCVSGYSDKVGLNFVNDNNLKGAFLSDNSGSLKDQYYIQITCYDFDKDKTKEVTVSIGDTFTELETYWYRFSNSADKAFEFVNSIKGKDKMIVAEDGRISHPFGYEYLYMDKNLFKLGPRGHIDIVENSKSAQEETSVPIYSETNSTQTQSVQKPTQKAYHTFWAESGVVITQQDPKSTSYYYKEECEVCGYVSTSSKVASFGGSYSESKFKCTKCNNWQKTRVGHKIEWR